MNSKPIGTYQLGWRLVEVYGDSADRGGSFYYFPDDTSHSRIRVGFDYPSFAQVLGVLIHEAGEFLLCEQDTRLSVSGNFLPLASDAFVFHFNHNQYSEVCARLGCFLEGCLPDVRKAYEKSRKKKR